MVVDERGGAEVQCRKSLKSQRVKCVRVGTSSRRRVRESLCPSAHSVGMHCN
jgi:hypothetical protein